MRNPSSALHTSKKAREGLFYLLFIAIGTGRIKANVVPFGAQQVDDLGPKAVQSFFNWFYWFIIVGSVIAFSGVAYVQQQKGFDVGFLIPLCSMVIALVIFVAARKKYIHKQSKGIGMILAACAMLYAGMLEMVRKCDTEKHGGFSRRLAGSDFNASNITMFAQAPEFVLIRASEVFTSISGLEFAHTQDPYFMQGLLMGLFLLTSGIGNYLASVIIAIVGTWRTSEASDWYPKKPNNGHLEYMLFLMAVLTVINLYVFIIVAKRYNYKEQNTIVDSDVTNERGNYDETIVIA